MQVMKVEQPREEDSGITLGTGPAGKSRLKLYGQNLQAMNHYPLRFCPFDPATAHRQAKVLRVLPSGRSVPHIQGFFNFTETRLATAGKS